MSLDSTFTLRPIQPNDSDDLRKLILDTDLGVLTTEFQVDAYTALTGVKEHPITGVVAEAEDAYGVVGIAAVTFFDVMVEGQRFPSAYLSSLKVRKDYRRRGLGSALARWRVEKLREQFSEKGVISTHFEVHNDASRGTSSKWSQHIIEPNPIVIHAVRDKAPPPMDGVLVRPASTDEYEEVAEKQNAFYWDYNLYIPADAAQLEKIMGMRIGDQALNQYYVAVNSEGELVAGARMFHRWTFMVDHVSPPLPLRLLNPILKMLPPDNIMRTVDIVGFWYQPDHLDAAQYLWQMLRWECRHRASTLSLVYDPRGLPADLFQLKPWHQPRPELATAVYSPIPLDLDRPIFHWMR
jgi:predicted N-acetyltransferase YhbS